MKHDDAEVAATKATFSLLPSHARLPSTADHNACRGGIKLQAFLLSTFPGVSDRCSQAQCPHTKSCWELARSEAHDRVGQLLFEELAGLPMTEGWVGWFWFGGVFGNAEARRLGWEPRPDFPAAVEESLDARGLFVFFVKGRSKPRLDCRVRVVSAWDPSRRQATGMVATRGHGHGGMVHGEMGPLRSRREDGRRRKEGQLLLAGEEEDDDDDDEEEEQWSGRKIPIQWKLP